MDSDYFYYIVWPVIFYLGGLTLITSLIAFGVLLLIFKIYIKEYDMDTKSQLTISIVTFGVFTVLNLVFLFLNFESVLAFIVAFGISFLIAQRLFIKSGIENKREALQITLPWFAIMIVVLIYII